MLFNSWEFLAFFVVVFALYVCLERRAQNAMLLVASYFFYGFWDWRFLGLLFISTAVDYSAARLMSASPSLKKPLLAASVMVNLGILGLFKYFNFFIGSAAGLLESFGLHAHLPALSIVLPVGISFYTFQSLGYTIDVYRGRQAAVRDPVLFALYVAFFAQLVAGPIERAKNLIPQFEKKRVITNERLSSGAVLILIGLVRKVAIADVAAAEVDAAFAAPGSMSSLMLARAALLFSLQIYNDFAGYSDIARGVARMLGIELMKNFEHPYFATDVTMFWRRWHVSLSTWLRDYLYIPLGGSRNGEARTYFNLMATMLLCGLWHGAAWTFVVWGGAHGLALGVHRLWRRGRKVPERPRLVSKTDWARAGGSWLLTMLVVMLLWVLFRAESFSAFFEFVKGMAALRGGLTLKPFILPGAVLVLMLAIDAPQYISREHAFLLRWPWLARGAAYAFLIMVMVLVRSERYEPFIYFQF